MTTTDMTTTDATTDERDARRDRIRGTLVGAAVGDALGAGYEFGTAPLGPDGPAMIGGGLGDFAPGEWTDDTTMTWCVADVCARGVDPGSEAGLTEIARRFRRWYETGPADIGIQTSRVLGDAGAEPTGTAVAQAAGRLAESGARTAGNGSLMRTAPVALAHLEDLVALAAAARAVSILTHHDPQAAEACVLWTAAIRRAVVGAELDVRAGLDQLEPEARERWSELLDDAERREPSRFRPNGFVVTALQAAWSAIHHTRGARGEDHVRSALATVIAVGDDTDTTASIAGALLGARWGESAIPEEWTRVCHGYPGITVDELAGLAEKAAT